MLNTNEDVSKFVNGSDFIFFNKKSKKFLNYNLEDHDLSFEKYLISTSEDESILMDKIQEIKMVGRRIFTAINQGGNIQEHLSKYKPEYWKKILEYVSQYHQINIPDIHKLSLNVSSKSSSKKEFKSFSDEYEIIVSTNSIIGKEFIQLLHDYGRENIDATNLSQLYNPSKLYAYLRNSNWSDGISDDFLFSWVLMKNTGYQHNDTSVADFQKIFKRLQLSNDKIDEILDSKIMALDDNSNNSDFIPGLNDFENFQRWILEQVDSIEKKIGIIKKK